MTLSEQIQQLIEGSNAATLAPLFDRVLKSLDKDAAFDALYELSDRQWHSYEKLQPPISDDVERWLLTHWNRRSLDDAQRLVTIVGHLGLVTVFERMREELADLPSEVKEEFQSFFKEVGDSVADPYSGMK